MASAAERGEDRAFSISSVLSMAFGVVQDNPVATFGIAFLFGALPQLVLRSVVFPMLAVPGAAVATAFTSILAGLIAIFCSFLVQGALVRATAAYARGERASLGETLSAGVGKALPLLLLSILMALGIGFGFLLLIVPGVILAIMWSVAVPALVDEDHGITEALGRSSFLTSGARWRILGLGLVVMVLFWLLSIPLGILAVLTGAQMAQGDPESLFAISPIFLIASAVVTTLTSAIGGAVQTSLFVALRDWKEGPQVESLADVFA